MHNRYKSTLSCVGGETGMAKSNLQAEVQEGAAALHQQGHNDAVVRG